MTIKINDQNLVEQLKILFAGECNSELIYSRIEMLYGIVLMQNKKEYGDLFNDFNESEHDQPEGCIDQGLIYQIFSKALFKEELQRPRRVGTPIKWTLELKKAFVQQVDNLKKTGKATSVQHAVNNLQSDFPGLKLNRPSYYEYKKKLSEN